ncbi:MAG: hypothetical protein MI865_00145 [Proteobacteria bacterium]|nr:hypothetical protein [Pseudomonadota bacterium]
MGTIVHAEDIPTINFTVMAFSVDGENPISEEKTDAVLTPFLGEHQGIEGLLEAASELENTILNAGFSFNRVILPPQKLQGGIVKLEIIQIKLGDIKVEKNEHFANENIIRSLPGLISGTVPDTRLIGKQLIVANNHPSKQITMRMKQSEQPNSVDAILEVKDQRPWQLFSILNNIGTPKTGRLRLTAGGQHNNLTGFDDSLTASYTTSPGHTSDVKQWGLNYRIPVYQYSGEFKFFYSRSDVDSGIVQGVFDVSGAGKFLGGSYTQTFQNLKNYRHSASIGVDDKLFDNNVNFGGTNIGTDVRSRPMMLTYFGQYQMEKANLNFDLSYARNLNGGNLNTNAAYTATRTNAEQDWDLIRYNATYNRSISKNWIMALSWKGQWSNEPLISGEQFGIGGVNSVRGFNERAVSGDRGDQATLQFSRPVSLYGQTFRIRFFSDVGHVRLIKPTSGQIKNQTLANIGTGLSWQWKDDLNISIDYAHELNDGRTTDIGGTKTHASIFYRF